MRKPYTIKNIFNNNEEVDIDLFEISDIIVTNQYNNPDTGELFTSDIEFCVFIIDDEINNCHNEYGAYLSVKNAVEVTTQMWKGKTKDAIRELFKKYV